MILIAAAIVIAGCFVGYSLVLVAEALATISPAIREHGRKLERATEAASKVYRGG